MRPDPSAANTMELWFIVLSVQLKVASLPPPILETAQYHAVNSPHQVKQTRIVRKALKRPLENGQNEWFRVAPTLFVPPLSPHATSLLVQNLYCLRSFFSSQAGKKVRDWHKKVVGKRCEKAPHCPRWRLKVFMAAESEGYTQLTRYPHASERALPTSIKWGRHEDSF